MSVGDEVCQGMIIGKIGDTGASEGEHLHFQFQACDTGETLAMGFSDGNGVPICTRGNDVFDEDGKYDFLILDNAPVVSCGGGASEDPVFDDEGWLDGECGPLSGCPMQPDCDRSTDHQFSDWYKLTAITEKASTYLWSECALDGKSDGSFSPLDHITKAEALKVSLLLFGLLEDCPGGDIDWEDLDGDEWQQPVLNCAVLHGILPDALEVLTPNEEISFAEAVKYAVMPAVSAGVVSLKNPSSGNLDHISKSHWAYKYAETALHYGGIVTEPDYFFPNQEVERREYAVMVAALSPCYCGSVECDSDCVCSQDQFACVDPSAAGSGIGGMDDEPETEPAVEAGEVAIDADCFVQDKWSECVDDLAVLDIQCEVKNYSDFQIKLKNLKIEIEDGGDCFVHDEDLKTGAAHHNLEAGEKEFVYGHLGISCPASFSGSKIKVSYDLFHKLDGELLWEYGIDDGFVAYKGYETYCEAPPAPPEPEKPDVPEGPPPCTPIDCESLGVECGVFEDGCGGTLQCGSCGKYQECSYLGFCVQTCYPKTCSGYGMQCSLHGDACGGVLDCGACPAPMLCDEGTCSYPYTWAAGYDKEEIKIYIWSEGGSYTLVRQGELVEQGELPFSSYPFWLQMDELPVVILVEGGAEGVYVNYPDEEAPPFAAYLAYEGEMLAQPLVKPDLVGTKFFTPNPEEKVLVVLPPPFADLP